MRFIFVALFVPTWLLSNAAAQAQSYLCVGDKATGFSFNQNTKQWDIARFNASQQKYIVRKPNERDHERYRKFAYVVIETGTTVPTAFCEKGFDEYGIMRCGGVGRFEINIKLGRYISYYMNGYVDENLTTETFPDRKEGDDTPAMTIGRCSPV